MALFGSDWLEDYDPMEEYENHHHFSDENYDPMKEYENYHHFSDEDYDPMDEYESGIKHFQE